MTAITTERDGPMAVITLDSPPLNLFDRAMTTGLIAALDELHDDPPRGLLIRAEGEVVSGGVNVNEFKGLSSAEGTRLWEQLLGLVDRVEGLPFPVVFAAHGLTLTAAFELSLACDLIIASDSARFGLVEIVVGLTPSMGGPQRLAERAGSGRARQLVMTGGLFDAATLERWNVVNEVKPDEELDGYARKLTMRLANGPTLAHAMTKRIVRAWRDEGMAGADRVTRRDAGALFETEDLKNAVDSFLREGPGKATYEGR
ncbi:MAG: enoyl-CoA hydratase/isomerase family protein [Solirubrobacterales bacterium]|nr:enoyl-CoA hydratase/isomerase family protein [Solirubrobacterales bacterium]